MAKQNLTGTKQPERKFEVGDSVMNFEGVVGEVTRWTWCDGMKALGVATGGMTISISPRWFYQVNKLWYDEQALKKFIN